MPRRKEEGFSEEDRHLAAMAKALGHPARITILRVLAKRGTCICGEIVEGLPLAQSTVSQHLKALKAVDLVSGTVDGPRSCYCLNWEAFEAMSKALARMDQGLRRDFKNCC